MTAHSTHIPPLIHWWLWALAGCGTAGLLILAAAAVVALARKHLGDDPDEAFLRWAIPAVGIILLPTTPIIAAGWLVFAGLGRLLAGHMQRRTPHIPSERP
jgi:hypothetical protein